MKNFNKTFEESVFKSSRIEATKVTYVTEDDDNFTHPIIKSNP